MTNLKGCDVLCPITPSKSNAVARMATKSYQCASRKTPSKRWTSWPQIPTTPGMSLSICS